MYGERRLWDSSRPDWLCLFLDACRTGGYGLCWTTQSCEQTLIVVGTSSRSSGRSCIQRVHPAYSHPYAVCICSTNLTCIYRARRAKNRFRVLCLAGIKLPSEQGDAGFCRSVELINDVKSEVGTGMCGVLRSSLYVPCIPCLHNQLLATFDHITPVPKKRFQCPQHVSERKPLNSM